MELVSIMDTHNLVELQKISNNTVNNNNNTTTTTQRNRKRSKQLPDINANHSTGVEADVSHTTLKQTTVGTKAINVMRVTVANSVLANNKPSNIKAALETT